MSIREHHLTVSRTARYATLGEMRGDVRQLWFACHGYAQLAPRFIRHLQPMEAPERLVVAPEGLSRFYIEHTTGAHGPGHRVGATWMTREDRLSEIADYVAYLDALHGAVHERIAPAAPHVIALGFSQGAATVSRWAALGRAKIDDVILWGGGLPPELTGSAATPGTFLRGARLTIVIGTRDEHATPERVEAEGRRLGDAGIDFQLVTFDGGHHLDADTLKRLAAQLERA